MSITKTLDNLETHMDYARDYFIDLQDEVDEMYTELKASQGMVIELSETIEELQEKNDDLRLEIEKLRIQCAILETENLEVTAKFAHYTLSS
jgi:regulator of replication initiation timing